MVARWAPRNYIAVIGSPAALRRKNGVAARLRQLGAEVRTLDLRSDPLHLVEAADDELGVRPRAAVFESPDVPELAVDARRALRRHPIFDTVGTLLVIDEQHVARFNRTSGFDDFVVVPFSAMELYVRIRALGFGSADTGMVSSYRLGNITVDLPAREVRRDGRPVALTSKELALLVRLCEQGGQAVSRARLLEGVWGELYVGSRRTVDIHVRRLRAKLGPGLELETVRGWGYRLRMPSAEEPSPKVKIALRARRAK
jgi:DNA-binding winged helix-turn-helix (wHTH) protein